MKTDELLPGRILSSQELKKVSGGCGDHEYSTVCVIGSVGNPAMVQDDCSELPGESGGIGGG